MAGFHFFVIIRHTQDKAFVSSSQISGLIPHLEPCPVWLLDYSQYFLPRTNYLNMLSSYRRQDKDMWISRRLHTCSLSTPTLPLSANIRLFITSKSSVSDIPDAASACSLQPAPLCKRKVFVRQDFSQIRNEH